MNTKKALVRLLIVSSFMFFAMTLMAQPDPKLIQRMQELSAKLGKATEAEKPAIMEALKKNAEEMMKGASRQSDKSSPAAGKSDVSKTADFFYDTMTKRNDGHHFEETLEAMVEQLQEDTSSKDFLIPKEKLFFFRQVSTDLSLGMSDYRRALAVAQIGIDQCTRHMDKGEKDIATPGDNQIFFERIALKRAKSLALALSNRIEEAKAAADEVISDIWNSYSDPASTKMWNSVFSIGNVIFISQSILPVLEAAERVGGEEEAGNYRSWAETALATETFMIDTLSKNPECAAYKTTGNVRMLVQAKGEILLLSGNATEAIQILSTYPDEAKLDPGANPYLIFLYFLRAKALAKMGNDVEALQWLSKAEQTFLAAQKTNSTAFNMLKNFSRWWPSFFSGQIQEKSGHIDEAIKSYSVATGHLRDLYEKFKTASARREFSKESDKVYSRLIRLLLEKKQEKEALEKIEESQSKAVLDLFGDTLKKHRKQWPPALKEKSDEIRRELDKIDVESGSGSSSTRGGVTRGDPAAMEQRRSRRLKLISDFESVSQQAQLEIQKEIDKKHISGDMDSAMENAFQGRNYSAKTLIDDKNMLTLIYLIREDPCWVVVLGDGKLATVKLPADAAKIRSAVSKFRKALVGNRDDWKEAGKKVFDLLISPIKESLQGKERLLVIPDGNLWYVPFGAIVDEGGNPLVSKFRIGIAPGVGLAAKYMLPLEGQLEKETSHAIDIVANPDGSLPHAQKEGESIAELAKSRKTWKADLSVGDKAMKSSFVVESETKGKYQVLHLATHGVLEEANPLYSYLIFSGAGDAGRFEVKEITNLDLRHISLAVLSACNTAIGTVAGGNEVICLQTAFQEAGIPCTLASLWEVSDESTARLMSAFYGNLFDGKSPGESMTLAIRSMLSEHPNSWAPFQVYGLP
ncbi:MAG: CHAT domain-containing protein [Candidatus Riflebacteria bacterium]|nr:CHAT domain-containing protein [Candidatus Riflebacteria bacterium]